MLLRCQIDLARTIFYLPHIETKKKRWKTKTSQNEENFKSAQAPAWKIWMIKICPGLARPQLFRTLVRFIIFHLFRLRLAELWSKETGPTHGNPWLTHVWHHLTSFDIISCSGDVSRKTLELPYSTCCVCWCLLALCTISQKVTRLISASDRLWDQNPTQALRHTFSFTWSALLVPSYAKNDRNDTEK